MAVARSSPGGPRPSSPAGYTGNIGAAGQSNPKEKLEEAKKNSPIAVKEFHLASDLDSSDKAHHHSLGAGNNQAAPGNHEHRLQGIWLYKDADGSHTSSGTYQVVSWSDFVFWDKELYRKESNNEIRVIKRHFAHIESRIVFAANATNRRGIAVVRNGGQLNNKEMPAAGFGATQLHMERTYDSLDLQVDDILSLEGFQNSGGNLGVISGRHSTQLIIRKIAPQKIDSAGLTAGGITPQTPGPEIASRQMFFEGAW